MAAYFLDTSALVKRYVQEVGSDWIAEITHPESGHDIYVLQLTELEAVSAIVRRSRGGTLPLADGAVALADMGYDFRYQYQVLRVSGTLIHRGISMTRIYGLRANDALQLAAAVHLQERRTALSLPAIVLVSAERELNAAATTEGVLLEDPDTH